MSAPPSKMKATIAPTLMSEKIDSIEPNNLTLAALTEIRSSEAERIQIQVGTEGNQ